MALLAPGKIFWAPDMAAPVTAFIGFGVLAIGPFSIARFGSKIELSYELSAFVHVSTELSMESLWSQAMRSNLGGGDDDTPDLPKPKSKKP